MGSILQAAVTQLLVVHKYILLLLLFVFIASAEFTKKTTQFVWQKCHQPNVNSRFYRQLGINRPSRSIKRK
jgi:hypothetical protein